MRGGEGFLPLALRTYTKDLQGVRYVRVTDLPGHSLEAVRYAEIQRLHAVANTADDVVMMMLPGIELVAVGAVAKIAAAHQGDFLHRGQAPINRHQIAHALFHQAVQFLRGKRTVFARENFEDRLPGLRDAMMMIAQRLKRCVELGLRGRVLMGHARPAR